MAPLRTGWPGPGACWPSAATRPNKAILYEDLCFNAQQASEKALKGVCRGKAIPFPAVHDLGELTELLAKNGVTIPIEVDNAAHLTFYAVQGRYPGTYPPADEADWKEAVAIAEDVVRWAALQIGLGPEGDRR